MYMVNPNLGGHVMDRLGPLVTKAGPGQEERSQGEVYMQGSSALYSGPRGNRNSSAIARPNDETI